MHVGPAGLGSSTPAPEAPASRNMICRQGPESTVPPWVLPMELAGLHDNHYTATVLLVHEPVGCCQLCQADAMGVAYVPRRVARLHRQTAAEAALTAGKVPQLVRPEAPQLGFVYLCVCTGGAAQIAQHR